MLDTKIFYLKVDLLCSARSPQSLSTKNFVLKLHRIGPYHDQTKSAQIGTELIELMGCFLKIDFICFKLRLLERHLNFQMIAEASFNAINLLYVDLINQLQVDLYLTIQNIDYY